MSTKQPVITGDAMIRALTRAGFHVIRKRGSHHFLAHDDVAMTTDDLRALI